MIPGIHEPMLIFVFLLLLCMSILSWGIIIWKAWVLNAERRAIAGFRSEHKDFSTWANLSPSLFSGALFLLFQEIMKPKNYSTAPGRDYQSLQLMHLGQRLDEIKSNIDKGLATLASIGSSATFVGLFGTVWGVYISLTQIASAGNVSLDVVAGPMGEALVSTAIGIAVAIPALLGYNAFLRINRLLMQELKHVTENLVIYTTPYNIQNQVRVTNTMETVE